MKTSSRVMICCLVVLVALAETPATPRPYAPSGLFIASIEEGARIFTPVRMFPVADTANSVGHQFPTALRLYGGEDEALEMLGAHAGLKLRATLQRYPRQPDSAWPYSNYAPPPVARIAEAPVTVLKASESPLPGLRAVCFDSRQPVCFIVDTRGLTLSERHMQLPTTMGLDLTHAQFMDALATAALSVPSDGVAILVYGTTDAETSSGDPSR